MARLNDTLDGKWCRFCRTFLPFNEFYIRNGEPASYCKPCSKEYKEEWGARDPEAHRIRLAHYQRQTAYGITREMYEQLPKHCELCGSEHKLHMDHDHETGLFRGVLCQNCNHGLGNFKDNPERLLSAVDYLNKHKGKEV